MKQPEDFPRRRGKQFIKQASASIASHPVVADSDIPVLLVNKVQAGPEGQSP